MNGQPGHWYYFSEALRNWAIAAAALFVFMWYGCDLNTANLSQAEVDARVKAQTEPLLVELKKLDAELKRAQVDVTKIDTELRKAQVAKEKAEGQIAELTATHQSTPIIRLKPLIEPGKSRQGVREFSLDVQISNDGKTPAKLRDLLLQVSSGQGNPDAIDKIFRTQRLWELESTIGNTPREQQNDAQQKAQLEADELHKECPHGQLFSLNDGSADVGWESIDRLSTTRRLNADLAPGTGLSQVFGFVLTESVRHNFAWYRIELTVHLAEQPSQSFTFFVPTGREAEPLKWFGQTAVDYQPTTLPVDVETVRKVWTTQSPLAPSQSIENKSTE